MPNLIKKNIKKILIFFTLASIFFFSFFNAGKFVSAAALPVPQDLVDGFGGGGLEVMVSDAKTRLTGVKQTIQDMQMNVSDWLKTFDRWQDEGWWAITWKRALSRFLNQMAYDTANWLATGNKGQGPMFRTDDIGTYLMNAADSAAGDFIDGVARGIGGKTTWFKDFNVCDPSTAVKIQIGLGLRNSYKQEGLRCTFTQMMNNWESAISDKNFLNNFQNIFDPRQNSLGVSFILHSQMLNAASQAVTNAAHTDQTNKGWFSIQAPISKRVKTPSSLTEDRAKMTVEHADYVERVYTGNVVADAIDIFISTLLGKLFEQWFNRGLVSDFPDNSYNWNDNDYESQDTGEGIEGAKERFRTLAETRFGVRGDYNILTELASCPDPKKAGPTNCVISDNFRQAIANRMTVGEAVEQGFLNGDGIFGVNAKGYEPTYLEGYPYRSLVILRKFRIVPVGWEVAASFIDENRKEEGMAKITLKKMLDCFDDGDDKWCGGLVDPNWVLKAPMNYCKKEGFGPEISSQRVAGTGEDSETVLMRRDNYCADEQTCIKEREDGTCDFFGYCTEERRSWLFNAKSCEPVFNTCETYRARDGKTSSYLKNGLDSEGCDAGNAGCNAFARSSTGYNEHVNTVAWDGSAGAARSYFNKDVRSCQPDNEGCGEFIRVKNNIDSNILPNSSFEDENYSAYDWMNTITPAGSFSRSADAYRGQSSLAVTGQIVAQIPITISRSNITNMAVTVSLYAKNCGTGEEISVSDGASSVGTSAFDTTSDWARFQVSHIFSDVSTLNYITLQIPAQAGCLIDAMQVELGADKASPYSEYREKGLFYEKLIPDYLNNVCYANPSQGDFAMSVTAPDICYNFARRCSRNEVWCDQFTSVKDGTVITAIPHRGDDCPEACVGYDGYLQSVSSFDSRRMEYFIPETAQSCSADSEGCDEFTNLDKTEQGGEAKEYYIDLKQCAKPNDACADFYAWSGQEDTGFQLRVASLVAATDRGPATVGNNGACDQDIFNLPPYDQDYNPNCREFYNTQGEVFYRLIDRVITCSDNCHPYRRTEVNTDPAITTQAACVATGRTAGSALACTDVPNGTTNLANRYDRCWDADEEACNFCKDGGYWSLQHESCLYDAIPGEGRTCSAAQSGCREYTGNSGRNIRVVSASDFENDSTDDWTAGPDTTINVSDEALLSGGHSLRLAASDVREIRLNLGYLVDGSSAYVLRFLAMSSAAGTVNAFFDNGDDERQFGAVSLPAGNWQDVKMNIPSPGHEIAEDEALVIRFSHNAFIDNIVLTRVVDNFYLIKNSWQDDCDYLNTIRDNINFVGEEFYAGCELYRDREDNEHPIFKFSELCRNDSVGCEFLIDTQNNKTAAAVTFSSAAPPQVTVPADNFITAIVDFDKQCSSADIGCQRAGEAYTYDGLALYHDKFIIDETENYEKILCSQNAVGCDQFSAKDTESYFKKPGAQTCEWRAGGSNGAEDWWRAKVYRCANDLENTICLSDVDCNIMLNQSNEPRTCDPARNCGDNGTCVSGICHFKCELETADQPCPELSGHLTIGLGGPGNAIRQPTRGWVGICPASQSGCAEYIDPLSMPSPNLIFNPDLKDMDRAGGPDGWDRPESSNSQNEYRQTVQVSPNTLYVLDLAKESVAEGVVIEPGIFDNLNREQIFILRPGNNLVSSESSIYADTNQKVPVEDGDSLRFYSGLSTKVTISGVDRPAGNKGTVALRRALVSYQFSNAVDKTTCNSRVDFSDGCIMFNERLANSTSTFDADVSVDRPVQGLAVHRDSSLLLKVAPDRVCDKWLACKSAVQVKNEKGDKENVCYDISVCDSLDDSGLCNSFPQIKDLPMDLNMENTQTGFYAKAEAANVSGYAHAGLFINLIDSQFATPYLPTSTDEKAGTEKLGFKPFGTMKQAGEIATVPNGQFEFFGSNHYPVGWLPHDGQEWLDSMFKVIADPITAQSEGFVYPLEGQGVLRYSSEDFDDQPLSEFIDVEPDTEYYLSAYVNTINLKSKSGHKTGAAIAVEYYEADGDKVDVWTSDNGLVEEPDSHHLVILSLENGRGWTRLTNKFRTYDRQPYRIRKIKINANAWSDQVPPRFGDAPVVLCNQNEEDLDDCVGNIYVDDIKIVPVLQARVVESAEPLTFPPINITQTCRLYPESDSLACSYFDDAGKYLKGWPGYCLQYDRFPGSEDACLQWWPIDRVKGDGIEEGAGYIERFPLYYSAEEAEEAMNINTSNEITVETPGAQWLGDTYSPGDLGLPSESWNSFYKYYTNRNRLDSIIVNCVSLDTHLPGPLPSSDDNILNQGNLFVIENDNGGNAVGFKAIFDANNDFSGIETIACDDCPACMSGGDDGMPRETCSCDWDMMNILIPGRVVGDWSNLLERDGDCLGTPSDTSDISCRFVFNFNAIYANKIVQVVTPMGQNKFWSGRVYEGSEYTVPGLWYLDADGQQQRYRFETEKAPFGSVAQPDPAWNPYEWDGWSTAGIQPLYLLQGYDKYDVAGLGQPFSYDRTADQYNETYAVERIKRMFAQSYNAWGWNAVNHRYESISGTDDIAIWTPPNDLCTNRDQRPTLFSEEFCGIHPKINDIFVNKIQSGPVSLNNNGFVDLTFNSLVDSQQLPLTMINVDWGDGESTIVSGVEMRDRRSPDEPHAFFHSYSYWDMRKRLSGKVSTLYCAEANQPLRNGGGIRLGHNCPESSACCAVEVGIRIMDNWGWCSCNSDEAQNNCDTKNCNTFELFPGYVLVKAE